MEAIYAPPDHPVFELVPLAFHDHVSEAYAAIGEPIVDIKTFWEVYLRLREQLRQPRHQSLAVEVLTYQDDSVNIPLLPNMEYYRLQPLGLGLNFGALPDGTESEYYADFTTDEEADSADNAGSIRVFAEFTTDDESDSGDNEDES
jgi:hypothetical protein